MRPEDITAIDVHVHLNDALTASKAPPTSKSMGSYFGRGKELVEIDELADSYRARNMMAGIVNTTNYTSTGVASVPNDHIAGAVEKHPDVFFGYGVVDPWLGQAAIDEVRRCASLGLRGIGELNPGRQEFFPDDQRFFPLWEAIEEAGLVVMFHGGMMGAGAGTPGGGGLKLKYCRPIPHLDDVAAAFPSLQIIAAHPAWPWQEESLAMAVHKQNVHIDLSGWAPKYFSDSLVRYANNRLSDRVLFGSDWPVIDPDRWCREFSEIDLKPGVRERIMLTNAARLFGIDVGDASTKVAN